MNCLSCLARVAATAACMVFVPVSAWASSGYIFDSAGSVNIAAGSNALHPALEKDNIKSGMMIQTGEHSYAVLKFEDGEVISMEAGTTLVVKDYDYDPKHMDQSKLVFSMLGGGMRFVTGSIGKHNPMAFRLATPQATISVLGTDFVAVITDKGLYSKVSSGRIRLTNAAGSTISGAGKITLTASSNMPPVPIAPGSVSPETFTQIASIPIPPAVPGEIPPPVIATAPENPVINIPPSPPVPPTLVIPPAPVITPPPVETAPQVSAGSAAAPATEPIAGGEAAGGGEAATTAAPEASQAGTSVGEVAVYGGVAVAGLVMALSGNSTTTTNH